MKTTFQLKGGLRPQPLRTWLTAWAALLLMLFASTAQAVHTHGVAPSAAKAKASVNAGVEHALADEFCPLCAAMHGASAANPGPLFQGVTSFQKQPLLAVTPVQVRVWSFDLFSRPPPSLL